MFYLSFTKIYEISQILKVILLCNFHLPFVKAIINFFWGFFFNLSFKFIILKLIVFNGDILKNDFNLRYPGLQQVQAEHPEKEEYDIVPGSWRELHDLGDTQAATGHNTASKEGKKQRNLIKHWVNSTAGAVQWQDRMI